MTSPAKAAAAAINEAVRARLTFGDRQTQGEAHRGFIAMIHPPAIKNTEERTAWHLQPYRFLDTDASETADPSLCQSCDGMLAGNNPRGVIRHAHTVTSAAWT